jgi:hypothetical protein
VGDHGAALVVRLIRGDGGYVYLPAASTVVLTATERPDTPLCERRATRKFGGVAVVDGANASLVRSVRQFAHPLAPRKGRRAVAAWTSGTRGMGRGAQDALHARAAGHSLGAQRQAVSPSRPS